MLQYVNHSKPSFLVLGGFSYQLLTGKLTRESSDFKRLFPEPDESKKRVLLRRWAGLYYYAPRYPESGVTLQTTLAGVGQAADRRLLNMIYLLSGEALKQEASINARISMFNGLSESGSTPSASAGSAQGPAPTSQPPENMKPLLPVKTRGPSYISRSNVEKIMLQQRKVWVFLIHYYYPLPQHFLLFFFHCLTRAHWSSYLTDLLSLRLVGTAKGRGLKLCEELILTVGAQHD